MCLTFLSTGEIAPELARLVRLEQPDRLETIVEAKGLAELVGENAPLRGRVKRGVVSVPLDFLTYFAPRKLRDGVSRGPADRRALRALPASVTLLNLPHAGDVLRPANWTAGAARTDHPNTRLYRVADMLQIYDSENARTGPARWAGRPLAI